MRHFPVLSRILAASFATALGIAAAAAQAPEKPLSLELNNARDANGGCRITYIALNETGTALEKASYQIVVFDADAKVAQFLILEFGSLPAGKTKVVEFDFGNRPCDQISRILVNDVAECTAGGAASPICLDSLKTATRTAIAFGL